MINSLADIPSVAAYLRRIGAEVRSMRVAIIKETRGKYWKDICTIKMSPDGKIECSPPGNEPTDAEAAAILQECANVIWPTHKTVKRLHSLPPELENEESENIFRFYDMEGNIVMIQVRKEHKEGKNYLPWTFWSDNIWRQMEPPGSLPIWGIEQLKTHEVAFIHEGAKAARAMREMIAQETPVMKEKYAKHPWARELDHAAHLGWIGGAENPKRTDWSELMKYGVKRVYIVSDNDFAGVKAVAEISFRLKVPTFHIQFTSEWPASFDLADPFPRSMFSQIKDDYYYTGPSFRACTHPATWATDIVPNPRGKPSYVLRDVFKEMWAYVETADMFVCLELPDIVRTETVLDKVLAGFSHTSKTCSLIVKAYTGRSTRLAYRPDHKGKLVTDSQSSAINLHAPTQIKSQPGDISPFLEFMDYMFPNPSERREVIRWCATLIARLEIRMEYGLLLVSERQGVGKTTLGAAILAPLVGMGNVAFPTEDQVSHSEFNGWIANKRLCVINEIYGGASFKAYHRLKSLITDKDIEVNEKYQRTYTVENWAHILACSNSTKALKVEEDDRRWFYPQVTEDKWPREKFEMFYKWLNSGGLSIIKDWAEKYGDYVGRGEPAPMTGRKKDLIAASRSEAQQEAVALTEVLVRKKVPIVLAMKDIVGWVRSGVQGKVYDSDLELRKAMKDVGAFWLDERVVVSGLGQYVCMNSAALTELRAICEIRSMKNTLSIVFPDGLEKAEIKMLRGKITDLIRTLVQSPSTFIESRM